MPYWSSSKVGADPQSYPAAKQQQKKKFKGKKGITMEDLKKQTAIRLAQEQQKKGRSGTDTKNPPRSQDAVPIQVSVPTAPSPSDRNHSKSFGKKTPTPPAHDNRSPYGPPPVHDQQLANYRYGIENKDISQTANRTSFYHEPLQTRRNDFDSLVPPNLNSSLTDSNQKQGKFTPKLPHGLTVQELKEMTKARLQAEASDKVVDDSQSRTLSSDHFVSRSGSFHSSPEYRDPHFRSHQHPSPLPPSFRGIRSSDSGVRVLDNREGFDNASVSTVASDYPASDSVYSGAIVNEESMGAIPFSRSGSNPGKVVVHGVEWRNGQDSEGIPTPYAPSTPVHYYDGLGYIANRQRAATMSPTPSSLLYMHEDRPVLMSGTPSISSPQPILPGLRNKGLLPTGQDATNQFGQPSTFGNCFNDVNNRQFVANRSRTSSLPSSFQSIDDGIRDSVPFGCNTPQRFSSQFEMVHEDAPSLAGLSSVFRDSSPLPLSFNSEFDMGVGFGTDGRANATFPLQPAIRKRAETDILLTAPNTTQTEEEDFVRAPGAFRDSRNRAATWDVGLGLFGSVTNLDDRLADDLASILKLSELDQKDSLFASPGF